MDKIQQLISKYLEANNRQTSMYMELEKARDKLILSKNDLHEKYHELKDDVTNSCLELVNLIYGLSSSEKLQLLKSDEDTYENPVDPWSLDDLYAREALFKYIINPSDEMVSAHTAHKERMIKEFKKYDE